MESSEKSNLAALVSRAAGGEQPKDSASESDHVELALEALGKHLQKGNYKGAASAFRSAMDLCKEQGEYVKKE